MSKTNLTTDLGILSGVAVTNLDKLALLSNDIISHAVLEAKLNNEPVAEIDLGIGILYILISEEELTDLEISLSVHDINLYNYPPRYSLQ